MGTDPAYVYAMQVHVKVERASEMQSGVFMVVVMRTYCACMQQALVLERSVAHC